MILKHFSGLEKSNTKLWPNLKFSSAHFKISVVFIDSNAILLRDPTDSIGLHSLALESLHSDLYSPKGVK